MADSIEFEIETTTNGALKGIFDAVEIRDGLEIRSPNDEASLTVKDYKLAHGFGLGEIATMTWNFLMSPIGALAISLAANWLYDTLKNRTRKISYGGVIYRITKEDLHQFVEDIAKAQRDNTNRSDVEEDEGK